jgi:very-short-patch-repair endonuclease
MRISKRVKNIQRMGKVPFERKSRLKKIPTAAELKFRELLKHYNIPHAFQKLVFTPDRYYILDFTSQMHPRTIFEIDGLVHDGREAEDREREQNVLKTRTYKRFSFVRIRNIQVFNGEAENVIRNRYPRRAIMPRMSGEKVS